MGKIKCPYCFEEFESDKVLFRANTGFTQEELDREEFTSGDVDEHKRLFVKFSQRNPDEKLNGVLDEPRRNRRLFQCRPSLEYAAHRPQ